MIDKATSVRDTLKAKIEHLIPARTGFAFTVDAGDYIEVVDVEGRQTADFWAFHQNDLNEYLSAPHTRIGLMHMFPGPGEAFFSNHRRPIIRVVEDRPPEVHVTKPAGDRAVTRLEEVDIEAQADDDRGVERLELVFAVRGGAEQAVALKVKGPRAKEFCQLARNFGVPDAETST